MKFDFCSEIKRKQMKNSKARSQNLHSGSTYQIFLKHRTVSELTSEDLKVKSGIFLMIESLRMQFLTTEINIYRLAHISQPHRYKFPLYMSQVFESCFHLKLFIILFLLHSNCFHFLHCRAQEEQKERNKMYFMY